MILLPLRYFDDIGNACAIDYNDLQVIYYDMTMEPLGTLLRSGHSIICSVTMGVMHEHTIMDGVTEVAFEG